MKKRYLGSAMTAYCGIAGIVLPAGFLLAAVLLLMDGISVGTGILAAGMAGAGICFFVLLVLRGAKTLYAWGSFDRDGIHVKTGFSKEYTIFYAKCGSIGIGLYRHGVMGTNFGSIERFIFLSYEPFEEKYRLAINTWRPSETRLKIAFREDVYQYFLTVLPPRQAKMLQKDYETYVIGQS